MSCRDLLYIRRHFCLICTTRRLATAAASCPGRLHVPVWSKKPSKFAAMQSQHMYVDTVVNVLDKKAEGAAEVAALKLSELIDVGAVPNSGRASGTGSDGSGGAGGVDGPTPQPRVTQIQPSGAEWLMKAEWLMNCEKLCRMVLAEEHRNAWHYATELMDHPTMKRAVEDRGKYRLTCHKNT